MHTARKFLMCYSFTFTPHTTMECINHICHACALQGEIAKAYRKLARQWHPDMHQGESQKLEAEKQFQRIATAYEVINDTSSKIMF